MSNQPDEKLLRIECLFRNGQTTEEALVLVGSSVDKLLDFWRLDRRVGPDSLFSLNLAYEELATNVARHSLPRSIRDIQLRCESRIFDWGVLLSLHDDGPRFDPTAVKRDHATQDAPPPEAGAPPHGWDGTRIGGVGLVLVRELFPSMAYWFADGWNNVIIKETFNENALAKRKR